MVHLVCYLPLNFAVGSLGVKIQHFHLENLLLFFMALGISVFHRFSQLYDHQNNLL